MPIGRLAWEWRNKNDETAQRKDGDTVQLQTIRDAYQELVESGLSYGEIMDMVQQDLDHRSDSALFVAALLYLLDSRPMSAQCLQDMAGLHGGHLYRFFDRAGIDWAAANGPKHNMRHKAEDGGLATRMGYYYAPLNDIAISQARVIKIQKGQELWVAVDAAAGEDTSPTLPMWPRFNPWLNQHRRKRRPKREDEEQ